MGNGASIAFGGTLLSEREQHFAFRSGTESLRFCITGMTCLPDDRIVMVDEFNDKLKVFDKNYTLSMTETLYLCVMDLTHVTDNFIALACEKEIHLYDIQRRGVRKLSKTFKMKQYVLGISYYMNRYALACEDKVIRILDPQGNETCAIKYDMAFGKPMDLIAFLVLDPEENKVYVSDYLQERVICLSFTGRCLWEQKLDSRPSGLLIVRDQLLVSMSDIDSVQVITSKGSRVYNLLTPEDHLYRPHLLAYQERKKRLIITNDENKNNIEVCKIFT